MTLPVSSDRDRMTQYCRDPLFEKFMTLPWPYELRHAEFFVGTVVPKGWASGDDLTWAIREFASGALLGMIGWRRASGDIGYWLGAPHRGRGLMTEATNGVLGWLFSELKLDGVAWECVVGNSASVSVARKAGFTFTGERPTTLTFRDGSHPQSWHGVLRVTDGREPKPGWPV